MTSPWARQALAAGGHLGDDVAYVIVDELHHHQDGTLKELYGLVKRRVARQQLAETLVSEDDALD